MGDVAIRVKGVSKRYEVFENQRSRLLHAFWPRYRDGMQEVWALRDVDFEIARGESVGVIGRNGGGKSTLLQILTGVLTPTQGEVEVNGRVSALLELGRGFNPAYTGRDNVVLNGLLLGLSREEILRRFDEIAAFAEIGEAIDRPVKTYSSGMLMRLAFAVQVLTDPEILIVDEALSVGDFFFQQKCFGRIRSLQEQGLTLVFVSHDMGSVRSICSRALYLKQGHLVFDGDGDVAVRRYLSETTVPVPASPVNADRAPVDIAPFSDALWRRIAEPAASALLVVDLLSAKGVPVHNVRIGDTVVVRVRFRTAPETAAHVSLLLKNRYDQIVSNVSSYAIGMPAVSSGREPFATLQFEVKMTLEAGMYSLNVALASPTGKNIGTVLDETGWVGPLRVEWDYETETAPFMGMFGLPVRAELACGVNPNAFPGSVAKGAIK
jgi:lipopolysaccharide transport system ATP-binding protein